MKPLKIISPQPASTRSTATGTSEPHPPRSSPSVPTQPPRLPEKPGNAHGGGAQDSARSTGGASQAREKNRDKGKPPGGGEALASQLDDQPVEACLEYLTRPHHSWDSANKAVEIRRERVAEHEASILARSFAFSRRSSMLSTFSATAASAGGLAALMEGSFASVSSAATAPAGFPVASRSGSKKQTGTLRKGGRLAAPGAAPIGGPPMEDVLRVGEAPASVPTSSYSSVSGATRLGTTTRSAGGPVQAPKDRLSSFGRPQGGAATVGKKRKAREPLALDLTVGGSSIDGALKPGQGRFPPIPHTTQTLAVGVAADRSVKGRPPAGKRITGPAKQ